MGVDAHFPRRAVLNLGHVVPDFTTPSPITTTTAIRTEESISDAAAAVISSVEEGKGTTWCGCTTRRRSSRRRTSSTPAGFNAKERKAFLQFTTGCSSLLPSGSADLHRASPSRGRSTPPTDSSTRATRGAPPSPGSTPRPRPSPSGCRSRRGCPFCSPRASSPPPSPRATT